MNGIGYLLLCLFTFVSGAGAQQAQVVLENTHFRYVIAPDGTNLQFVDTATGTDYLKRDTASPCALVKRGGKEYRVT